MVLWSRASEREQVKGVEQMKKPIAWVGNNIKSKLPYFEWSGGRIYYRIETKHIAEEFMDLIDNLEMPENHEQMTYKDVIRTPITEFREDIEAKIGKMFGYTDKEIEIYLDEQRKIKEIELRLLDKNLSKDRFFIERDKEIKMMGFFT